MKLLLDLISVYMFEKEIVSLTEDNIFTKISFFFLFKILFCIFHIG